MNKVVKFSALVGVCAFLALFPASLVYADELFISAADELLDNSYYYTEDNVVYDVYSDYNNYSSYDNYDVYYTDDDYYQADDYGFDSVNDGYYDTGSARRSKAQVQSGGNGGSVNSSSAIQRALDEINERRAMYGIRALSFDKNLNRAAAARVKELTVSFSHIRPNGRSAASIITEYGGDYGWAGENVAYGMSTPEELIHAWSSSSSHNSCMLSSDYSRAGIGTTTVGGNTYWVLIVTD